VAQKSNLHISRISLPKHFLFKKEAQQVISQIELGSTKRLQSSQKILEGRQYSTSIVIQGLYDCFKCMTPSAGLSVPLHRSAYSQTDTQKITTHSWTVIDSILKALDDLGWIEIERGGMDAWGDKHITTIKAVGELLERFKQVGIVWEEVTAVEGKDVIILRDRKPEEGNLKDKGKKRNKEKIDLPVPDTKDVERMRKNLEKINHFIRQQAICLDRSDKNLMALAARMLQEDYEIAFDGNVNSKKARVFNFAHVQLRRIFSRGSMERGGRFYGGWWQFIPKDERQYITINGMATIEFDYSEMHPRFMYLDNNLKVPEGDLYDIGEQYKPHRSIIKTYLNALLNDDTGRYQISSEEANILGLSSAELRAKLKERHPILKDLIGKGKGLDYQYKDSKIAEKIMLNLMKKRIVCLPIHDSFICDISSDYAEELLKEMNAVYQQETNDMPIIKQVDKPQESVTKKSKTDFQIPWKDAGDGAYAEIDRAKLQELVMGEWADSISRRYVNSWRQIKGTKDQWR